MAVFKEMTKNLKQKINRIKWNLHEVFSMRIINIRKSMKMLDFWKEGWT